MHPSKKSYSSKNIHFRGFWVISALAFVSFSCKKRDFNSSSAVDATGDVVEVGKVTKSKWNDYIQSVDFSELQKECYPKRYPAKGKYKGVAVFYHGFSACPQQFWDLAQLVSAEGYEVYLPLLPGHGMKKTQATSQGTSPQSTNSQDADHTQPQEKIKLLDNSSKLPRREDWMRYTELSDLMTKMVRFEPAQRLMAGLSVGGALATHSALTDKYSGTWTRSLILAPMYQPLKDPLNQVTEVLGFLPILKWVGHGWGEGCEKDSLQAPQTPGNNGFVRGGFCNFKIENLNAISWLGKQSLELIRSESNAEKPFPKLSNVQLVAVDFDVKTRGQSLVEARANLDKIQTLSTQGNFRSFKFSSCSYADDVPHSFLSRYDDPDVNGKVKKVWLNSFLAEATGYLVKGTAFKENGESPVLKGYSKCVIDKSAPEIPWSSPKAVQEDDGKAARLETLYPQ